MQVRLARGFPPRPRILDTGGSHRPELFSNLVFLAEDVLRLHFFPHSTRAFENRRYSSGAPCQGSFDERVRNRALDRSAPLNALKPSRVSRRKKLVLKGKWKMQNRTEKRDGYGVANEWLTSAEAALYPRIERRTLLLWVRQGKVRAYILSGTRRHVWRFKTSDLDAMLSVPAVLSSDGRTK
jgi:excisionase family DNA binding protein